MNNLKKLEKELASVKDSLARIEETMAQVERASTAAAERLDTIRGRLPQLLASREMGDKSVQDEINGLKSELSDLEETLKDAPMALAGLKALQPALGQELRKFTRELRRLQKIAERYDELLEQGQLKPHETAKVREYAEKLGIPGCNGQVRSAGGLILVNEGP